MLVKRDACRRRRRPARRAGSSGRSTPCGVHRVAALAVAVPDVDGDARERRSPVGQVGDRQLERHRHALGGAAGVAEAGPDVAAHDAALLEDVRAVGAVAGVGAGGLVRDLARRRGRRPTDDADGRAAGRSSRRRRRPARRSPRRCRGRRRSRRRLSSVPTSKPQPLVDQLLVRPGQDAALVGGRRLVLGRADHDVLLGAADCTDDAREAGCRCG